MGASMNLNAMLNDERAMPRLVTGTCVCDKIGVSASISAAETSQKEDLLLYPIQFMLLVLGQCEWCPSCIAKPGCTYIFARWGSSEDSIRLATGHTAVSAAFATCRFSRANLAQYISITLCEEEEDVK